MNRKRIRRRGTPPLGEANLAAAGFAGKGRCEESVWHVGDEEAILERLKDLSLGAVRENGEERRARLLRAMSGRVHIDRGCAEQFENELSTFIFFNASATASV